MSAECNPPISTVFIRRIFDLSAATVGCILSSLHLLVLLFIRHERKGRKFDYLLVMSALSIITPLVVASGGLFDLCVIPSTGALSYYRNHIWLFAMNALYCIYGYMVLVLCIDCFIGLHRPMLFISIFKRLKIRVLFTLASVFIGSLTTLKWFHFEQLPPDLMLKPSANDTAEETSWFVAINALSCLGQYFLPGILMIGISAKNVHKVRKLRATNFSMKKINGTRQSNNTTKQESQQTIAKICALLAFFYCVLNWNNGIWEFVYTDPRNQELSYGIAQIFMNLSQATYLLLNMFIFAYSSRIYRRTLVYVLKWPFVSMGCFGEKGTGTNGPLTVPTISKFEPKIDLDETVRDLFMVLYHHSTAPQEIR